MKAINELLPMAINAIQTAFQTGQRQDCVLTGFSELDRYVGGFENGDLIVVGARPGVGKTAFLCSLALNVAQQMKQPVMFYTFESSCQQLCYRLLANVNRIDGNRLAMGQLTDEEWKRFEANEDVLKQIPLFISDDSKPVIEDLCNDIRSLVENQGIQLVLIDYLQLLNRRNPSDQRYQDVAGITKALKQLAREMKIPIVVASQTNRNPEWRNERAHEGNVLPEMYDLRDSGTICEDANLVMLLNRPEMYYRNGEDPEGNDVRGLANLIVAKNNNGSCEEIKLRFHATFSCFEDYTYEEWSPSGVEKSAPSSTNPT